MDQVGYARVLPLAVISAACAVASVVGLLIPQLSVITIPGVVTGALALNIIGRYELAGRRLANLGLTGSSILSILVPLWVSVVFFYEAPTGYLRLNYGDLATVSSKFDDPLHYRTTDNIFSEKRPLSLGDYVGQRICLKGYVEPGKEPEVTSFFLSSDGSGNRLQTHVEVMLPHGEKWSWNEHAISVCGTLERVSQPRLDGFNSRYVLKNATVRKAYTRYLLKSRASRGC